MTERDPISDLFHLYRDEDSQYALALGIFIEQFSITEFSLLSLLIDLSGMDIHVGKAAFGQARTEYILDKIRRVCAVRPLDKDLWEEVDDFLAQAKSINTMRNNIIHIASSVSPEEGRIITNMVRVHLPENEERYRISPEIVNGMTADLVRITAHAFSLQTMKGLSFEERSATWAQMKQPWQYKSLPNIGAGAKRPKLQGHKGK